MDMDFHILQKYILELVQKKRWSDLQPKGKMRTNAIKLTTREGKQMETTRNEDTEAKTMKGSYSSKS